MAEPSDFGFGVEGNRRGMAQFYWTGVREGRNALMILGAESPPALAAALNELGLFMEREIKVRTRVRTGRLRSSIGHFTPGDLQPGASARDGAQARAGAVFQEAQPHNLEVMVGTRVRYAPHVNYRLGDLMFERGLQATINFIPEIVRQYIDAIPRPAFR
jgi:hypothetical protein